MGKMAEPGGQNIPSMEFIQEVLEENKRLEAEIDRLNANLATSMMQTATLFTSIPSVRKKKVHRRRNQWKENCSGTKKIAWKPSMTTAMYRITGTMPQANTQSRHRARCLGI